MLTNQSSTPAASPALADSNSAPDAGTVLTINLIPLWLNILVFAAIACSAMAITATAFYFPWSVRIAMMLVQVAIVALLARRSASFKIRISPQGIGALNRVQQEALHMKGARDWDDLHSVRLRKVLSTEALINRLAAHKKSRLSPEKPVSKIFRILGGGWLAQGFLLMDFRSGGTLYFPLAGFSPQALEDLFIAMSSFADPKILNPEVVSLQRDIFTGQPLHLTESYTKMWEDDLRSHFQATNFVPLAGGSLLQNGALKVLMQLACGGMSSIYLVTTPEGERRVLKELAPQNANSQTLAKVQELFNREAKLLSKLDHPQIVKLFDHFVDNGRNYIVLEYIAGLNLRQHVKMHGPFSEAEVLSIALQAADILQYLHSFNPAVIHRDFTPDNLVTREPDKAIVLIDFGAANEFIGNATGTLIGKQSYIPAEQFRGEACTQSDLFSLGATLFYLLTGKEPEPISVSSPRKIVPEISAQFDAVIVKLTQELPEERYGSALELKGVLEELQMQALRGDSQ